MSEIINKVAQSALITFNLEDYYISGERRVLDIKDWLFQEMVLKEKDFRAFVKDHNWEQYNNSYVAIHCSVEAIVPVWAYMLINAQLQQVSAKKVVLGGLDLLETSLYQEQLATIDYSIYTDKAVIIKGCSNKPVPDNAYLWALEKLQVVSRSIMYGEACSAVPLFKKRK